MLDITDPFLTNQSRRDFLEITNNPIHLAERVVAQDMGKKFGASSYWEINSEQLIEINEWSIKNDLGFNFYTDLLKGLNPDYSIILTEQDRIQKGEWDNFYNRFSPVSYQNTCVVAINGILNGELPTGLDEKNFIPIAIEKEYEYGKYPRNDFHQKEGRKTFCMGILDAPIHLLKEEDRTYKETYLFSKNWEEAFDRTCGKQMREFIKDNPEIRNKVMRNVNKIKKSKKSNPRSSRNIKYKDKGFGQ